MNTSRRMIVVACVLTVVWVLPSVADAFYILSLKSEACHERLMLGSLQATPGPFGATSISAGALLDQFSNMVERRGVPTDQGTSAFIDEIAERFAFAQRPRSEQLVLASFVAGVRHPDTDGLSVVKFNETRSVHLQDDKQPLHALRKSAHNNESGDAQAASAARGVVVERVQSAVDSWRVAADLYITERWSFAFYGEVDVQVFGPAFHLGRASHVVQDAFAHTLRDEQMRITSVSNFVDALQERYFEPRDGPTHSDRLDECDVENSAFDEMRVVEARDATASLLEATTPLFEEDDSAAAATEAIEKRVDPVLGQVFALKSGCTYDNDYCDSTWTSISNSDLTEPFNLSLCSASLGVSRSGAGRPSVSGSLWIAALASVLVLLRRLVR